ncbi:MAG TPA: hypothetical protein VMT86_18925 [Bryobacteraceae bacterium]|nr:hypothetical protein [Bryobacteraceae bacterium]
MKFVTSISVILLSCAAATAQTAPFFATGQSARLVIGQPEFDAESDTATQNIVGAASGLAYANNTLFVVDANLVGAAPVNNRVLLFNNLSSQLPAPNAKLEYSTLCPVCVGTASLALGQSSWTSTTPAPCIPPPSNVSSITSTNTPACTSSDPQTPIATGMRQPTAVATDGTHLAVADTLNNRVLIWNSIPTTMNQAPDVVVGQPNFTSNAFPGDTPTASSLRGPQGVWIQNGKLYIADTQNDRVLIYNSIPAANGASADVVLGQPNMTTWIQVNIAQQNTSAAANNMLTPVSVTSDGTRLFVTDLGYNRILIWNTIPSSNQQPADVEIGQQDMTTGIPNDAYTTVNITGTTTGVTTKEVAALCTVSNGIDVNSNPTYPSVCEYTLSFPRFALSDGTHLYVADGGNDRVLIYNTIPTANAAAADIVLGQTDFVTDAPTDGADTMNAPLSIAFDGSNLYVADTYNQRILVYTESEQDLPYNGVLNSASLVIYALDTVTIGGTVKAGDKVTITIGVSTSATTETYTYTIQSGDNYGAIVNGLVALINAGSGDPNVLATPDIQADKIVLTARVPGAAGNNITVSTSISANAEITAAVDNGNLSGGGSAASIAPGTLVSFLGTNLSDQTASASIDTQLPLDLGGVEVYFNGVRSPLIYVSPTQINAQVPFNFGFSSTGTATAWVRITRNNGAVVATNSVAITLVQANPGIFAQSGKDPRKALAYHSSSSATGVISVDGTIKAGNIGTICIGSNDELTATSTFPTGCSGGRMYSYIVQPGDSLQAIQRAFVELLQDDSQVTASISSEFTRIILTAKTPGTASNGIGYQAVVNTGSDLLLTAIGPAPPSPGSGATLCCASTAGAPVTTSNPVVPGEIFVIYATGLGVPVLSPTIQQDLLSGQPYKGPSNNYPQAFVSALVDKDTANVLRAELAPGMIGIYQVYLQLSAGQTTNPVAQLTIAQNTYVSNTTTIPVFSVPQLSSMSCTPATLTSNTSSTCTVVLTVASPTSSTTVNLSSNVSALSVPSTVVVPANSTTGTFTAAESTVSSSQTATITATLGTATTTTTITVGP